MKDMTEQNVIKSTSLLTIEHLNISFTQYESGIHRRVLSVIQDLNVQIHTGELVAIVGSSGSGKSLLAHAVLDILPYNASMEGKLNYCGTPLTKDRIRRLRGSEIVLVPQSIGCLDPLMKIGPQLVKGRKDAASKRCMSSILHYLGLEEELSDAYPFELSGGMNRRVLIGTALAEQPKMVIADEPTPGLDPAIADRVIKYFRDMADQGIGVLLITHDLELALRAADRIVVFYAGNTVEEALPEDFRNESSLRHPYTKALWRAMPQNGFQPLAGTQPYVRDLKEGCPFADRCSMYTEACSQKIPYRALRSGYVRCLYAE